VGGAEVDRVQPYYNRPFDGTRAAIFPSDEPSRRLQGHEYLMTSRIVLVTGASSGIGRAVARHLHGLGWRVYGTSRRPAAVTTDATSVPLLEMDITSDASVERAVAELLAREGRIDAVVNNAGFGIAGAIEDTSIDEARAQMETNFFGTLRVCRAVLPAMRAQGHGCLVNVSSIAGVVALPFQGLYSASKFAVEGMSEALRMEVAPFGVRVALVEPGDFHTGFTSSRSVVAAARSDSPYASLQAAALGVAEHDETKGATPEAIGPLIEKIIAARSPRLRYSVGPLSERLSMLLKRIAPGWLFEQTIAGYYGVKRP
jgi:NAD(P)-dependent dehydrogenase (short-subunit alcohol dehydrogenase family)